MYKSTLFEVKSFRKSFRFVKRFFTDPSLICAGLVCCCVMSFGASSSVEAQTTVYNETFPDNDDGWTGSTYTAPNPLNWTLSDYSNSDYCKVKGGKMELEDGSANWESAAIDCSSYGDIQVTFRKESEHSNNQFRINVGCQGTFGGWYELNGGDDNDYTYGESDIPDACSG